MTSRRRQILMLVHDQLATDGLAPSVLELAAATGTTNGAITRHLQALERDGFLRRTRKGWRALEVIRLPGHGLLASEIAWCHANPERVRALIAVAAGQAG